MTFFSTLCQYSKVFMELNVLSFVLDSTDIKFDCTSTENKQINVLE